MQVLLLNAGSSSLKAALVDASDGSTLASGTADWAGVATRYRFRVASAAESTQEVEWRGQAAAVQRFIGDLRRSVRGEAAAIAAVGHRIVHGGRFTSSVRITRDVRQRIQELAELAPLHNPPSLEALAAAEAELPDVPHVAVFDTAFHAALPPEACTYPLPQRWTREWGIRRYGFHGLSHAYCAIRAAELLGRPLTDLRLVICHLGHGCSAAAVQGGRCVDTTMGFTPLEGLMMGTRSGTIDPAILLHVEQRHGLSAEQVERTLYRESGLLGVSGVSADMREVLSAAQAGHAAAQLAIDIYCHRVRQAIGALAVTLGGVDALVFTAGVGEHSSEIREQVCRGLECLGLPLDRSLNRNAVPDADIAEPGSRGRILVIATREDVTMLREVAAVVSTTGTAPATFTAH